LCCLTALSSIRCSSERWINNNPNSIKLAPPHQPSGSGSPKNTQPRNACSCIISISTTSWISMTVATATHTRSLSLSLSLSCIPRRRSYTTTRSQPLSLRMRIDPTLVHCIEPSMRWPTLLHQSLRFESTIAHAVVMDQYRGTMRYRCCTCYRPQAIRE
jgi:hypothetical protein